MKLSAKALSTITVRAKNRLALELNCSVPTVDRWIKDNEENSDLTKFKSVQILSEESGLLPIEILVEELEDAKVTKDNN